MDFTAKNSFARIRSNIMAGVCAGFAFLIVATLLVITGYLFFTGLSAFSASMFTKIPIPPGMEGAPGGMLNGILGTIALIALASVVGIPLGMLTGIYLSEYENKSIIVGPVRFVCDVLAGVPSIVVGILGYELLVVPAARGWFQHIPYFQNITGYSGWAGAMALAFIMIPIVARTTEEMLRLVPASYREASIALGATKATSILGVVVPAATGSIVTGVMLAVARVAGETAPLLFTALASRFMPISVNVHFPFVHFLDNINQPYPSLTVQIFTYAMGPDQAQQNLARGGILVLVAMIFVLNLTVRYATRSRKSR